MFGGGFLEIGFFLFIAYLLFGPKKVPEIARTLGKGMGELRRASNELRNSLEEEIKNLDRVPESGHDHHDTSGHDHQDTGGQDHQDTASTYGHHDSEPTSEEPGPRS